MVAEDSTDKVVLHKQKLAECKSDSERLPLLIRIGRELVASHSAEAEQTVRSAATLARKLASYADLADAGRLLCQLLLAAGRLDEANECVGWIDEAALALGSRRHAGQASYLRGQIHELRGECQLARDCYEEAMGHWQACGFRPGVGAALNQLGNLFSNHGSPAEALHYYQDCLAIDDELNDNAGRALRSINIGVALQQLGRWEDAVTSFYRALATIDAHKIVGQRGYALLGLGEVFLNRDHVDRAIQLLTAAVDPADKSDSPPEIVRYALNSLTRAYLRQGNLAKASETVSRAMALAEASGDQRELGIALTNQAELSLRMGDPVRATELARRAAALAAQSELRPDESEAWRLLAQAAAARGEYEEARTAFERAVALLAEMEESYELAKVRLHYGSFLLERGEPIAAAALVKPAGRVFRRLGVVADAVAASRLLFRTDLAMDRDMALLGGISGLAALGLPPGLLLLQSLELLCEGLGFDSAALVAGDRLLLQIGSLDSERARAAMPVGVHQTDTVLRWPLTIGGQGHGWFHLERSEPRPAVHSELVLEAVSNLLAPAVESLCQITVPVTAKPREVAELRYRGIVSRNPQMLNCLATASRVAETNIPVLILGESGTGKELVARALHDSGPRAARPFVAVNCAAVPEDLLEAEFFGVEKGAATGVVARQGKLEAADGGTIFLDEIGDMSPALQAKLLRVLEEHCFERVGGRRPIRVDVRVVAATNREPATLIANGHLRADLYYRLNGVELRLPSLRQRAEDIPDLVSYFISCANHEFGRCVGGVSPEAMTALVSYNWPGNIRELEHVIEQAVLLAQSNVIEVINLPDRIQRAASQPAGSASTLREARRIAVTTATADAERQMIVEHLTRTGWNVRRAALAAGYSRAQFYRLMRKHGITRPTGLLPR